MVSFADFIPPEIRQPGEICKLHFANFDNRSKLCLMSHLSRTLTAYLDATAKTNRQVEIDADLANGSLHGWLGHHKQPTVASLQKLIESITPAWAAQFLRAYLLDHIPASWRDRVEIKTMPPQSNIILFPEFTRQSFKRERLLEARLSHGFTQTELADKMDVSVETISNLESGQRNPSPEMFRLLCDTLGFPAAYFSKSDQAGGALDSAVFFRSFVSKTKRQNLRLGTWRVWAGRLLDIIGTHVTLPPVKLPDANWRIDYGLDLVERAEALAQECRRLWGLGDNPIGHLTRLVEAMGVCVIRLDIPGMDSVDGFSCWQDGRPLIFLIGKESACRERLNVAHELLHLIAHRQIPSEELDNKDVLRRIEREAFAFAAALQLPRSTYTREVFSFHMEQFRQLKERWKVSMAAQANRCRDLGLMDDDQFTQFRKNLSWNGFNKKEPLDDSMPTEQPAMISQAINLLASNGVRQAWSFVDDLGLPPKVLSSLSGLPSAKFEPPSEPAEFQMDIKARPF